MNLDEKGGPDVIVLLEISCKLMYISATVYIYAVDYFLLLHIGAGTILCTIREPRVISFSTSQTNFLQPILLEKSSVSSSSLPSFLYGICIM